ncbi:LytTR family DNA-binding domain-containing protein [Vibrio sp. MACH09]|uniref:LytR/AlgR family response regulator transcription factor n=1 Tax=Vibrio sp. MACH09 TaxID=3025122 RepID=UPI00295E237A|nr:LytTR family DNA-binding domain-containing protein [Vibrio sp. MACH09]
MSIVKCIIVDDESLARDLLGKYINKMPKLELKESFDNAIDALDYIQSHDVDLVFSDIEMPDLSGIDFVKSINGNSAIIFTTAYEEFALQGYELNVVDYLLKPFSLPRFISAVNKATEIIRLRKLEHDKPAKITADITTRQNTDTQRFLFVRDNRKEYKVFYDDILFVEGALEYVSFQTQSRHYLGLYSLKELEKQLPSDDFVRVHKSYIVSLKHIKEVKGNLLVIHSHSIPVGKTFKTDFNKKFNLFKNKR